MLRVEPVPLARVVSSSVRVLPPSHAAECAPVRDAGDPVRAVVGSVVEFRLSTSSPCIGLRTPDGRLVGEVDGARVTVRRPVTGDDTVTYTTSTVAGDGPGVFTLDVRALEDFPPTLRFVGEGVNGDTLTIVAGGSARFGVLATDDVALRSEAFDVDVPAGATVRTERVDHARSRAGVVIDGAAFTPGDRFDVVARAADTVPERAPVEERLVVEVISAEEAIARERAALTIEALAGPSERVAQALLDGDSEAVRAALDGLSNAGQSSAFAREAAEDAARLLKRVEREGLSQHAALEGERTLEDDAARLRVGDELRRWGEALVRLTDEQVALGASPDPSAEEQRAHEDRLVRIASALRTLGTRAMLAPMDQQTLVGLRASIVRARETLEGRVGAWREGEDEGPRRAHDTVITDLHFALDDLLREDAGAGDLDGAASEALRLLRRVRADAGERAAEIDGVLGLLEELVLAVRGEARPALPMMGASAVWIAQRLDEMGVRMVMVDAARAMESGEAHGRDLAREAGALLLSLREESASGGEREETGAGDAPLSLTPGASAPARASRSSSSSDGEAPGDALREALDILSANRARAGEAGAMPDAVRDGGEEANRGGARIATGGDGEGVGLGGSSVPANARTDDEGDPIDAAARAAGVQAWIVEETLELTPGEAERLAGVPEAYRSIVAAYLRAIAGGEGDRIE
ncbi:MAG: hypothetical protein Tsb0013_23320 [Phycisphaerales bacterium]